MRTLEYYQKREAEYAVWNAFQSHRSSAKARGIRWKLTFEEWCDIWLASGKWAERGQKRHQYCMHRMFDIGPYAKDNVEIITNAQNFKLRTKVG